MAPQADAGGIRGAGVFPVWAVLIEGKQPGTLPEMSPRPRALRCGLTLKPNGADVTVFYPRWPGNGAGTAGRKGLFTMQTSFHISAFG